MDLKEVLAKLATIPGVKEAIGDEGLTVLTSAGADPVASKKLQDAEAKAGRILAEKKEAQERAAALEAEIETLKTGSMTESDKMKTIAEKETKRAAKAEADLSALQAEFGKAKRTVALDKLAASVKFIDAVNPEAGRILLEASLAQVSDLSNADEVTAALGTFKESHKALIAADSQASGGGTGRPNGAGASGAVPSPDKMTDKEREKDLKDRKII
jgi:hypothetical protein